MAFTKIDLQKNSIREIAEKIQDLSFFFVFSGRELLAHKGQSFLNKEDFLFLLKQIKNQLEKEKLESEAGCSRDEIKDSFVTSFFFESQYSYVSLFLKEFPRDLLSEPAEKYFTIPLTKIFADEKAKLVFLVSRARSLSAWISEYKFCPTCGGPLFEDKSFSALCCPACNKELFPRLEPCVIVLVRKDDKILLARHKGRFTDRFVCISGFIEAGESAEEAVFREVKEETGISVKNIRFMGSQSWPFPDQLMLAFEADWERGEIKIQEDELLEAAWFPADQPPSKLSPGSVAYKLINGLFDKNE